MQKQTINSAVLSTLVIFLPLLSPSANALSIRSFSADRHGIFVGFPSNPTPNTGFYHKTKDFSGVGWSTSDTRKHFTLISPKHFVCANHFRPPLNSSIRFMNRSGVIKTYTIGALHTVPNSSGQATDILVGELTAPIPSSDQVSHIPYYNLSTEAAYSGTQLLIAGRESTVGVGTISGFLNFGGDPLTSGAGINSTRAYTIVYNTLGGGGDDCFAEGGDSGGPSFASTTNGLAIVGTHTAVLNALGTTTTIDSFLPNYAAEVNAILEQDGYHLSQSTPSTTTLQINAADLADPVLAGGSLSYSISITNTGSNAANNLDLAFDLPNGLSFSQISGTGWVAVLEGDTLHCLRGGLAAGSVSTVTLNFTAPGTAQRVSGQFAIRSDESAMQTVEEETDVLLPYSIWAQNLTDTSALGDDDNDDLPNALEFGFGGDPDRASQTNQAGESVLPFIRFSEVESEFFVITYRRRRSPELLNLTYLLEVSSTLESGDWQESIADANGSAPVTHIESIESLDETEFGFERVTAKIAKTEIQRIFARVSVSVDID
jgi:uncharacterized repeat protein (TIGR01451 family)